MNRNCDGLHPSSSLVTYEELKLTYDLPNLDILSKVTYVIPNMPNRAELARYEDRLDTFTDWPISLPVSAEELASAGFFYKGYADKVECYCCGASFKQWLPGDDPWKVHSEWFDACKFLRNNKNTDYIKKAKPSAEMTNYLDREKECCKICFTREKGVVYVPCGHIVACRKCGISFTNCPTCRARIKEIVQIYYS